MTLLFRFTGQLTVSRISIIHKEVRFGSKPFIFSCVAPVVHPVVHPVFIPPCIGALVHLYSGALSGY